MRTLSKLFYVVVLVCFLPAYTQLINKPVIVVAVVDSIHAKEIDKIKRSILIDLWLVKFRIGKRLKADSVRKQNECNQ